MDHMDMANSRYQLELEMTKMRYAQVIVPGNDYVAAKETIARYLPGNYEVTGSAVMSKEIMVEIAGEDFAGWTLDDYVIPRLASGLYFAKEVEK